MPSTSPLRIGIQAREASRLLAHADTERKNKTLCQMAMLLREHCDEIIQTNQSDLEVASRLGFDSKVISRLTFDSEKVQARINALFQIAGLPDPVGQMFDMHKMENGLMWGRKRVPLGVILVIYEARPHVTINAGAFCLKSGNASILRGGSEAKNCNRLLGKLWQTSLKQVGLPPQCIQVISGSYDEINELLQLDEYVDLVIPRGGRNLIKAVVDKSRIPVIKHYAGICHVYIDEYSRIRRGIGIAIDSKCLMPEVCNAMETLLVSEALLPEMRTIVDSFRECGVTVKGCPRVRDMVPYVEPATEEDWRTEYLDKVLSIRVVENVNEAIMHINHYGSHHTDAIVTDRRSHAMKFVEHVDSSVVLVNASTMFCDGKSLGMGAEIGISTDKLHARGPMGLKELTSYKFVIMGEEHVMGDPQALRNTSVSDQVKR